MTAKILKLVEIDEPTSDAQAHEYRSKGKKHEVFRNEETRIGGLARLKLDPAQDKAAERLKSLLELSWGGVRACITDGDKVDQSMVYTGDSDAIRVDRMDEAKRALAYIGKRGDGIMTECLVWGANVNQLSQSYDCAYGTMKREVLGYLDDLAEFFGYGRRAA